MKEIKSTIFCQIVMLLATCIYGFTACHDDSDENQSSGNKAQVETQVIQGVIEKGPFVQDSQVTLYELTADLQQTDKRLTTQTTSDLGAFRFESPLSLGCQFVEIEASGCFYHELRGGVTTLPVTLRALSDIENRMAVNVNLLTHLEADRVKSLVKGGKGFHEAKRQAEKELLACFAITDEIAEPEGISIKDNTKNSAVLLAITTVMLYDKKDDEFMTFIDRFTTDFADDGKIDSTSTKEAICEGQKYAHPSVVARRLKRYYAEKGTQIECEDFSRFIDFNGDGLIDENDQEYLAEPPVDPVTEESVFNTKEGFDAVLSAIYLECSAFESWQLQLEGLRTNKETVHSLTPQSTAVIKTYTQAYTLIRYANMLLEHAPSVLETDPSARPEEMDVIVAETKCLRAFVYYQLAMLWGDVVIATATEPLTEEQLVRSKQADVYQFAYTDICEAVGKLLVSYNTEAETKAKFTRNAALMLKAEIELAMGYKQDARNTLDEVENTVGFSLANQEQTIPVYTPSHLSLYQKEASGDTAGLETEWAAMTDYSYGYWATLKRLGKAQTVTGCYDYELLMPVPYEEMARYPNITQNPGY